MTHLKAYLDQPSRAPHLLGYHELQGFIFAMVNSADLAETYPVKAMFASMRFACAS